MKQYRVVLEANLDALESRVEGLLAREWSLAGDPKPLTNWRGQVTGWAVALLRALPENSSRSKEE